MAQTATWATTYGVPNTLASDTEDSIVGDAVASGGQQSNNWLGRRAALEGMVRRLSAQRDKPDTTT